MRALLMRLILAGAGAAFAVPAIGCSCGLREDFGFIHANVENLPANARGAVFLPPLGGLQHIGGLRPGLLLYTGNITPLRAASFSITDEGGPGQLPVQLTILDTPLSADGQKERSFLVTAKAGPKGLSRMQEKLAVDSLLKAGLLREITRERRDMLRMVRVGPAGGFTPGHRYHIRYLDKASKRWSYPSEVTHRIDAQPVSTGPAGYALVADGPPLRRMIPLITGSGSCSSGQPAIVQDFHYAVPLTHARYRDAMLYLSSTHAERRPAAVPRDVAWPPPYWPSLCEGPPTGLTTLPEGRDVILTSCEAAEGRASVSGWVGLLEVEDRVWPAGALEVDFSTAQGRACGGYQMLGEALAGGDTRRIAMAACGAAIEEWRQQPDVQGAPPLTALLPFVASPDPELANCTNRAAARLVAELPQQSEAALAALADVSLAALRSGDRERIDVTLQNLRRATAGYSSREKSDPASLLRNERLLLPLTPALIDLALAGNYEAKDLIGLVAPQAAAYVPRVMAAAQLSTPGALQAIAMLELLAPDDPAFHALLVRHAEVPAMLEPAALAYERVAGKAHPAQAVALLAAAAEGGSDEAMSSLQELAGSARASAPALIRYLARCAKGQDCTLAITVLTVVSDGSKETVAALATALARSGPMREFARSAVRDGIATMDLGPAQRKELLALLDKVPRETPD